MKPVFIVFDGPPSHDSGRFVEVETADGKSVSAGEWKQSGEYWNLGPFYTADQLAQVVQQRDELLKSMKYLQEYRLWSNGHAKAIIDSAIAKVQP